MPEPISRYFAFTKRSIKGPFYPKDLAQLPDFGRNTLVCPETALGQWREASLESAFQSLLEYAAQPQVIARRSVTRSQLLLILPLDYGLMRLLEATFKSWGV